MARDEGFALLDAMVGIPLWTMLAFCMLGMFLLFSQGYTDLTREWEMTTQWREISQQLIRDVRYAEEVEIKYSNELVLKNHYSGEKVEETHYTHKRKGNNGILYKNGQPICGNDTFWAIDIEQFEINQESPYRFYLKIRLKDKTSGKTLELNTRVYNYYGYRRSHSNETPSYGDE